MENPTDTSERAVAVTFPQANQDGSRTARDDLPPEDAHRLRRTAAQVRSFIDARGRTTGLVLKWIVALVGLLVIAAGVLMLVLPGPGIVTILLGVAILGVLSPRLEELLHRFIDWAMRAWENLKTRWALARSRSGHARPTTGATPRPSPVRVDVDPRA